VRMDWDRILADAGIPPPPGQAEAVRQTVEQRQQKVKEARGADAAAIQRHEERLAAQGDTRKAFRSKVRVGR
jgi:Cdc6-like AAA superfamily ATPase